MQWEQNVTTTEVPDQFTGTEAPVTTLSQPVQAGATVLNVASQEGFSLGGRVVISGGGNSETATIASFGSIVLAEPLQHSYPASSTITGVVEATITTTEVSFAPRPSTWPAVAACLLTLLLRGRLG
jgi:hypothetical protein